MLSSSTHSVFCPGRTTDSISSTLRDPKLDLMATGSSYSQRSPCWSSDQPTLPQLFCTQTCLRPPHESPMPLGNSLSHASLHGNNNNGGTLHGKQRRGARAKVMGKKPTRRTYAYIITLNCKYIIACSGRLIKSNFGLKVKINYNQISVSGI